MRIENGQQKLDFRDVLIRPQASRLSSRQEVTLTRIFSFPHTSVKWELFPIVASNMDATGTTKMARALLEHGASTALSKYIPREKLISFFRSSASANSFYSLGIRPEEKAQLDDVRRRVQLPRISVEVANGYIPDLARLVTVLRRENPDAVIMAGSVCTPEGTLELIRAGADIARVGIGSGSVCITRRVTGVGFPQLSAAIECADAAHSIKGLICSDGGCTVPGDICKAFGAGADFVMLGGMLAGHDESAGKVKYRMQGGKKIASTMEF